MRPSVDEQMNKMWYTHTMEYFSDIIRKKSLMHRGPETLQLIQLPSGLFHSNQSLCCHPTWAVALVTRPWATRVQGLSQD